MAEKEDELRVYKATILKKEVKKLADRRSKKIEPTSLSQMAGILLREGIKNYKEE